MYSPQPTKDWLPTDLDVPIKKDGVTRVVKTNFSLFKNIKKWLLWWLIMLVFWSGLVIIGYWQIVKPPADFTDPELVVIPFGTSVLEVAQIMKDKNIIRSKLLLYTILITKYKPKDIKASTYFFTEALDVYAVAKILTEGDYRHNLVRLTHKEGMSVKVLAPTVQAILPQISATEFVAYASPYEGELFPETYFVPNDISLKELVDLLRETYTEVITDLKPTTPANSLSANEVLILASIIEREANSATSMKTVANILLRRLVLNMPLQVDATLEYVLDKPLPKLTADDLINDSPYNTYTRYGLPPTPIGNPGRIALEAALEANGDTPYLFYLTGNDGEFYYARNFAEHKTNIAKYLK